MCCAVRPNYKSDQAIINFTFYRRPGNIILQLPLSNEKIYFTPTIHIVLLGDGIIMHLALSDVARTFTRMLIVTVTCTLADCMFHTA